MNKIIAKEYKILKKVDGENIIYAKIVYLGNGDSLIIGLKYRKKNI